jgi:hypothetical protein
MTKCFIRLRGVSLKSQQHFVKVIIMAIFKLLLVGINLHALFPAQKKHLNRTTNLPKASWTAFSHERI